MKQEGRFKDMSPQEFIDTVYNDLVKFMDQAQVAASKRNEIATAMFYGAASAAWEGLNDGIKKYGVIPTAWQVNKDS